jgi:hypothetical protein
MNEQVPVPRLDALAAEARCVGRFAMLLGQRRIRQPREHLGMRLQFADGSTAPVYRETVIGHVPANPCVLVVAFRLRLVRGFGHQLFRWESLLNTPLFVGYSGYVSKLWLAHDEHGAYRGVYEWDDPELAQRYARSLWRVLELVCEPESIRYHVLPGMRRDAWLVDPSLVTGGSGDEAAWWRIVGTT